MVALVTGASRGIGKAIALELARIGYELALVGRNPDALESVAKEIDSVHVRCISADLSLVESAREVVEETVRSLGGIDLLVDCAGVPQKGSFTRVLYPPILRIGV